MTDEFVDFYEILELPVEAERSEVRKRISELYIEAQKNLDHRNFNTRVRHQQLFEMTLPQARYILLDAGRRDDYDRLVRASRGVSEAPGHAAPAQSEPSTAMGQNAGFPSAPTSMPGASTDIDALPDVTSLPDPAAVAREREELWNKWKSGLQSAMERENARESGAPTAATTPLSERIEAVQSGAPQPQMQPQAQAGATAGTAAQAASASAQAAGASATNPPKSKLERPRVKFEFDGETRAATPQNAGGNAAGAAQTGDSALSPQQIEERRNNHRREITREELEATGLKGMLIGASAVLVPGVVAMTIFMSVFYPRNQESILPLKSSAIAWLLWLVILAGLTYWGASMVSKSMRRKRALQLQTMSYDELLRHMQKES